MIERQEIHIFNKFV